jgi:tRNA-specific 2-thiouridylase
VSDRGEVLGAHEGHDRFTVGQRKGLGIASAEPLYVLKTDARTNRVTVGPRSALATDRVRLTGLDLRRPAADVDRVKLRYRQPAVACSVEGDVVRLPEAVDGAAPGQTACLMRGDVVLGWGTIDA